MFASYVGYVMHRVRRKFSTSGCGDVDEGFTLVELLIVIVVLGILAAVVIFNLGNVKSRATVSACETNVAIVQTAVSAYNV